MAGMQDCAAEPTLNGDVSSVWTSSVADWLCLLDQAARRLELERQRGDLLRAQNDILRDRLGIERTSSPAHVRAVDVPRTARTPLSNETSGTQHFNLADSESERSPGTVWSSPEPRTSRRMGYIADLFPEAPAPKVLDLAEAELEELRGRLACAEAQNRELEARVEALSSLREFPRQLEADATRESAQEFFEHVRANDVNMVRAALAKDSQGALLAKIDPVTGARPLHVAAVNGCTEVVKCLLEFSTRRAEQQLYAHRLREEFLQRRFAESVDAPHPDTGRSAFAEMMRQSTPPALELAVQLLQAKADPCRRDRQGMTPFLECVAAGHMQHVQNLVRITQGTILPVTDDAGRTPLHVAAANGRKAAVEFLLKIKADPLSIDASRRTPADVAEANGHDDIVAVLGCAVLPTQSQTGCPAATDLDQTGGDNVDSSVHGDAGSDDLRTGAADSTEVNGAVDPEAKPLGSTAASQDNTEGG